MSQYTTFGKINLCIYDLDAIKDACQELHLSFRVGGTVRYYWGHNQITADYVISIEGCPYDVGLIKDEFGNFKLVYDTYGGHVEKALGKGCHRLVQSAIFHKIRRACNQRGKPIIRRQGKTSVFVEITI